MCCCWERSKGWNDSVRAWPGRRHGLGGFFAGVFLPVRGNRRRGYPARPKASLFETDFNHLFDEPAGLLGQLINLAASGDADFHEVVAGGSEKNPGIGGAGFVGGIETVAQYADLALGGGNFQGLALQRGEGGVAALGVILDFIQGLGA